MKLTKCALAYLAYYIIIQERLLHYCGVQLTVYLCCLSYPGLNYNLPFIGQKACVLSFYLFIYFFFFKQINKKFWLEPSVKCLNLVQQNPLFSPVR